MVVSVVSVVSVVRKKFIGQIYFILSRTTSCICRFFCIEHLYAGGFHKVISVLWIFFRTTDTTDTTIWKPGFIKRCSSPTTWHNLLIWNLTESCCAALTDLTFFFLELSSPKKTTKLFIFIQVVPFKWTVFILATRQENEKRQLNENTSSWKATCNAVRLLFNKNATGKVTPHTLKWMRNWRRYNLQKHYIWK